MNSLGSSTEIVQNKLIILYIVDRLNMPVSNNAITRLVLETRLMNYFMFQQCFNELIEGKLLTTENLGTIRNEKKREGYTLTVSGKNTLQYFLNHIPQGIKKQLDKITSESHSKIQLDSLVTADYTPESENKYSVVCKIDEKGFPLIELKAAAGTKKEAQTLCGNWKKYSSEIYREIMEALIKKRD